MVLKVKDTKTLPVNGCVGVTLECAPLTTCVYRAVCLSCVNCEYAHDRYPRNPNAATLILFVSFSSNMKSVVFASILQNRFGRFSIVDTVYRMLNYQSIEKHPSKN